MLVASSCLLSNSPCVGDEDEDDEVIEVEVEVEDEDKRVVMVLA